MRILYYSPHPSLNLMSPAGSGTHIREVINAFRELGHEVLPVIIGGTTMNIGDIPKQSSFLKNTIKKIVPTFIWETLKDYRLLKADAQAKNTLEKHINGFKPELIYERGNYLQSSGVEVAKKYQIRHYIEINAPYIDERKTLQGYSLLISKAQKVEKKQILMPTKVLVVSSALKEYFSKKYIISQDKFVVTPNAINVKKIISDKEISFENIDKKNNLIIGFVGSIFPWHGVAILIHAFHAMIQKKSKLQLLIVGGGEILEELKALAKKLSIEEFVTFTGDVPPNTVYNYIDLMDICVLAKTAWYCSPIKIFEYGAMGKAVIAPDTSPVKEVMEHNKEGLLIKPTIENLTEALQLLVEDKGHREMLAANFKKKVLENYTWEKVAKAILKSDQA